MSPKRRQKSVGFSSLHKDNNYDADNGYDTDNSTRDVPNSIKLHSPNYIGLTVFINHFITFFTNFSSRQPSNCSLASFVLFCFAVLSKMSSESFFYFSNLAVQKLVLLNSYISIVISWSFISLTVYTNYGLRRSFSLSTRLPCLPPSALLRNNFSLLFSSFFSSFSSYSHSSSFFFTYIILLIAKKWFE